MIAHFPIHCFCFSFYLRRLFWGFDGKTVLSDTQQSTWLKIKFSTDVSIAMVVTFVWSILKKYSGSGDWYFEVYRAWYFDNLGNSFLSCFLKWCLRLSYPWKRFHFYCLLLVCWVAMALVTTVVFERIPKCIFVSIPISFFFFFLL